MITSVLIDIDDTLLDFKQCSRQSVISACQKTDLPFTEELMNEFYNVTSSLWLKIEQGTLTKPELYNIRFGIIFDKLKINANGNEFERLYRKQLYESDAMIEGAKELLIWLSERFTVCAASNAPYEQQVNRLKKTGLLHYFSHLFISEKIGFEKPSKDFFKFALNTLNASPNEVLLIGDSLSADIIGGLNSGIHTCWFCRKKDTPTGDILPEHRVDKLSDIPKLSLFS